MASEKKDHEEVHNLHKKINPQLFYRWFYRCYIQKAYSWKSSVEPFCTPLDCVLSIRTKQGYSIIVYKLYQSIHNELPIYPICFHHLQTPFATGLGSKFLHPPHKKNQPVCFSPLRLFPLLLFMYLELFMSQGMRC